MALTGQVDVPVAAIGIMVDRLKGSILDALMVIDMLDLSLCLLNDLVDGDITTSQETIKGECERCP